MGLRAKKKLKHPKEYRFKIKGGEGRAGVEKKKNPSYPELKRKLSKNSSTGLPCRGKRGEKKRKKEGFSRRNDDPGESGGGKKS